MIIIYNQHFWSFKLCPACTDISGLPVPTRSLRVFSMFHVRSAHKNKKFILPYVHQWQIWLVDVSISLDTRQVLATTFHINFCTIIINLPHVLVT